jgi:hypothetical protein
VIWEKQLNKHLLSPPQAELEALASPIEVSDMSIYDEYRIVINEAQRRVIMRSLTNTMAEDRLSTSKGGTLSRPTQDEYMQLIRLFSTIKPSVRK